MHIIWHGQSCFQLIAQREKVGLIIDPVRIKKADVFLLSQPQPQPAAGMRLAAAGFLIDGPGEYERKGVFIQGIPTDKVGVTYYTIEADEMRLCHLAVLPQKELTDVQLEELGNVDILILPAKDAAPKIISQLEPAVVIPMYEKGELNKFLKAMGQTNIKPEEKLVIKKKDLPQEETKIVVLTP